VATVLDDQVIGPQLVLLPAEEESPALRHSGGEVPGPPSEDLEVATLPVSVLYQPA
jgi:hypothetical protein